MTRLFGVIGDPIAHSLSPLIHRGWMRDLGLDADYHGFHVRSGEAKDGLITLAQHGVSGLNVTAPHKAHVIGLCESVSPLAARLGVANTLTRTDSGGWRADNTDRDGFLQAFQAVAGSFADQNILILGAGGAATAILDALVPTGANLTIANRTRSRAESLRDRYSDARINTCELSGVASWLSQADMVVNCLHVGTGTDILEPHLASGSGRLFYDTAYGAGAVLGRMADLAGWRAVDGLSMLIAQAALSFEIWHGEMPDLGEAERRCRTALEAIS